MIVDVVIPIHKQIGNIDKIFAGLNQQTTKPNNVHLILDRTELVSDSQFANCEFNVLQTKFYPRENPARHDGFHAGDARNIGIDIAIEGGADIVVMIDGDCVPQPRLIEGHVIACNRSIPILSCGRRREKKYGWKDQRELIADLTNIGFFSREIIINDPELLRKCMVVWSCNIAMNQSAIIRMKEFNRKYYTKPEVFSSAFDGGWGGEDSFLGVEAWMNRTFIVANHIASVEHIDHPRISDSIAIEHKKLFESMLNDIRKKTVLKPLDLDFFTSVP